MIDFHGLGKPQTLGAGENPKNGEKIGGGRFCWDFPKANKGARESPGPRPNQIQTKGPHSGGGGETPGLIMGAGTPWPRGSGNKKVGAGFACSLAIRGVFFIFFFPRGVAGAPNRGA